MKHIQKLLSVCLVILLFLSLLPVSAVAASGSATLVTVDGVAHSADGTLTLSQEGKQLVYAEVTHADGSVELLYTESISVQEGDSITTHYLTLSPFGSPQARICSPTGLRFVTEMNTAEWESVKSDGNVKKTELGTLISPMDLVEGKGALDHAHMGEGECLDVAASRYKLYDADTLRGKTYFAGSIVHIKTENYNRTFAGIGYVRITMKDGTVRLLYASDPADLASLPSSTIAVAAIYQLEAEGLSTAEKTVLRTYKNAYNGAMETLYAKDLAGLNVLAIGDSLFYGANETVGDRVWVNALGKEYGWNLTNLGLGDATVSYDPDRTATNASMYGLLMSDPAYAWGSTDARFYQSGSPSGNAADVDLILLEGGSNDYGTKVQAPRGEIGSRDPATFLGAWTLMTEALLERYPNATVVFVTAWKNVDQAREDGAGAADYTSSVVLLYNSLYGSDPRVKLINAGEPTVSGVQMVNADGTRNNTFINQYAYDAFHLNNLGMELMADHMREPLWELWAEERMVARTVLAQMAHDLGGLNVLAFGDSLFSSSDKKAADATTRAGQWVNLLGAQSNWSLTNLGVSGMTVSYTEKNYTTSQKKASMYDWLMNGYNAYHWNTDSTRIYQAGSSDRQSHEGVSGASYNKYFQIGTFTGKSNADVDLILLEGGCNDYGTEIAAPLGTVGSTDGGTFIGAYHAITQKLLADYPNAKIVFITTWQLGNQTRPEDTLTSVEYSESVISLYEQCYTDNDRVYLIDAGNPAVSGVNMRDSTWRGFYSNDSYHLKDSGMQIMAEHMLPYLWKLMCGES